MPCCFAAATLPCPDRIVRCSLISTGVVNPNASILLAIYRTCAFECVRALRGREVRSPMAIRSIFKQVITTCSWLAALNGRAVWPLGPDRKKNGNTCSTRLYTSAGGVDRNLGTTFVLLSQHMSSAAGRKRLNAAAQHRAKAAHRCPGSYRHHICFHNASSLMRL